MSVNLPMHNVMDVVSVRRTLPNAPDATTGSQDKGELRQAFQSFVGQTLFGQMLKAMRKTVGKPAYFHGGRTEEIFRQQLDEILAEKISEASADKFSGPMFELFTMKRL